MSTTFSRLLLFPFHTLLSTLVALPIIGTALPLLHWEYWWIRMFDFPRMQLLIIALAALVAVVFWRGRSLKAKALMAAMLIVTAGYQAYRIYPYTPLAEPQVLTTEKDPDDTLDLMVSNVLMDNRNADQLLALVEQVKPDLLLALEPDKWWEQQLKPLEKQYPYTLKAPLDNRYGLLFYSRLELIDPELRYLVKDDIPSIRTGVRLPSGREVTVYGVHPEPPSPTEAETSLERDVELLLVADEVEKLQGPVVVMGDLNDVAWSYTTQLFQETSQLLDPRIGRGMFNSYNAKNPLMRWPLDHVFIAENFMLVDLERLPSIGSDHFPIHTVLSLKPQADELQKKPERPDADDRQNIRDKMDKAGKSENIVEGGSDDPEGNTIRDRLEQIKRSATGD